MKISAADETVSIIDACMIKGRFNNERYNMNVPDSFYIALKNQYVGKRFIQKHDEPRPYLYRTFDCAKYSINKNDTLDCVDVRKVVNYPLLIRETPVALVFRAPDGEICWTTLEHSHLYIEDLEVRTAKDSKRRADFAARETKLIRKYGRKNGSLIAQGKVAIGFSMQMCKDAWGEPTSIHKTTTRYGVNEQWVYNGSYLYFENGKLTAIQN